MRFLYLILLCKPQNWLKSRHKYLHIVLTKLYHMKIWELMLLQILSHII